MIPPQWLLVSSMAQNIHLEGIITEIVLENRYGVSLCYFIIFFFFFLNKTLKYGTLIENIPEIILFGRKNY